MTIPKHIAIIMDGNGRWAQQQGKARPQGHKAGAKVVQAVIEQAYRHGVKFLTLFAFSSENWQRPKTEVRLLMELFLNALDKEVKELHRNNVKLKFIGDIATFETRIQQRIAKAEQLTAENTALQVNIAVGYGGHWDITQAAKLLAQQVETGQLSSADVTPEKFAAGLQLAGCATPDLFIRTGGEQRISNFLLWDLAYTELYFTDVLWPDFAVAEFDESIRWYSQRQRRFGKVLDEDN